MIKEVLVVDDEPIALDRLERLLKKLGVEKIYRAENYLQAKGILNEKREIKVVFLDIKMPGKSGIELAEDLKSSNRDLVIILQTAYPDYALEGYRIGAIHYLVKPYTVDELQKALERAKRFLGESERKYLQVENTRGERKLISFEDILYIKADLKHSMVRTEEGFFFCHLCIGDLEHKLKNHGFLRVHRSYLVNLSMVHSLEDALYGKLTIKFKKPIESITTSKSGASLFREQIKRLKRD